MQALEAARVIWNAHFNACRTCGNAGRLCAAGARLHTTYATIKTSVERPSGTLHPPLKAVSTAEEWEAQLRTRGMLYR